jgi:ribosomal protein L37AE/L43A
MSCERIYGEVFECDFCETQFERGVAGETRSGEPRCPQCGLAKAHRIAPEAAGPFVVTRDFGFG